MASTEGSSALLRAARNGNLERVLEMLKSGIDINSANANGLNALHLASKEGHSDIVRELLKRGANVDAATKKGNTALHIASLAGQEIIVQILIEYGANVNVQSLSGFTPLYMAAQENHDMVVTLLLKNGANQNLATEDGFTPLAVALQQGHDRVVAILLENDTRGKVRLPALHIAAKKDDTKAATLLLQNEHNPDVASKSGFTPLHIASHYGNESIGQLLLQKGANVNFQARHNITPLHVAAKWGRSNMVSLLLAHGAVIDCRTRDLLTPLHCAARSGHDQVIDLLLEKGAPISAKTKNGLAPLHMAAQGDHVDSARILLYHRAPVDDVTVDYLTPLHVAAHCGHVRVAKLLLDRNAGPNARALNGFTPLHIACKKNRIKVVELLLKYQASIEATTESGLTPLHVSSFMGCMNICIYLIQQGAEVDAATVRGETPLHLAARANQTDIVRILLRNSANVDAKARELQTPLHIASRLGNTDICMLLIQGGADVDAATRDLYTPLHIAAKEGQEEVATILLDHGAKKETLTKKGFTPLHLAAKYGNYNVAKLLLERGTPVNIEGKNQVTPLHVAAHYNNDKVAMLLLEKSANPRAAAKNGYTPLHIAAKKNQLDIAATLLSYKAEPNAESKAGFTPLHLAAQEGHKEMAALLLQHEAEVNASAKNGLTPMHLCAQEDRVDVAEVLVEHSADIDPPTKAGYTPLHVACHFGQINMVKFLLRTGAKVDSTTRAGYTPLHQAAQQGHNAVVRLLIDSGASPNAQTTGGQTPLAIAQRLGYVSVIETLRTITETTVITETTTHVEERYRPQNPEVMNETFMSESEDEGDEAAVSGGRRPKSAAGGAGAHSETDLDTLHYGDGGLTEGSYRPDDTLRSSAAGTDLMDRTLDSRYATLQYGAQTDDYPGSDAGASLPRDADRYPQYDGGRRPHAMNGTMGDEERRRVHPMRYDAGLMESPRRRPHPYGEDAAAAAAQQAETFGDNLGKGLSEAAAGFETTDAMMHTSTVSPVQAQQVSVEKTQQAAAPSPPSPPTVPVTTQKYEDLQQEAMHIGADDQDLESIIQKHQAEQLEYKYEPTGAGGTDNVEIQRGSVHTGFLISFMVDARGGAMRGCRHSGVRIIVPPRKAPAPMRVTCRYLRKDKLVNPPPLCEGEGLASRILEMGPAGAKFLGPVILEVPHFASLRGREREIVILRSDDGEHWKEHQLEATEDAVQEVLNESFDPEELSQLEDLNTTRITRILTSDFPQYFAVVTRIRQEVHAVGPDGGMIVSTVVPQVQAVFPEGSLTKTIKVSLQAQPVPNDVVQRLHGNRVAVSPIITVEPRRRKFHKPITLCIPLPQSSQKSMLTQYSGQPNQEPPTLRLLCSITGGAAQAQWEDITGTTQLTFSGDMVSFTTTVSARFWLMDCQTPRDAARMAQEVYSEAAHVPYMSKFVVFARRHYPTEGQLRVFCMTDDKEDKTLEKQEHFTEIAKSRDVEVLSAKDQYLEFAGNLLPVTKSGEQLHLLFHPFQENRLAFVMRVRDTDDQEAGAGGRIAFMKEPKSSRDNLPPQHPICTLAITLPEYTGRPSDNVSATSAEHIPLAKKYPSLNDPQPEKLPKTDVSLAELAREVGPDWQRLARALEIPDQDMRQIKHEYPGSEACTTIRIWMERFGDAANKSNLEQALQRIGREDAARRVIHHEMFIDETTTTYTTTFGKTQPRPSPPKEKTPEALPLTLTGSPPETVPRVAEPHSPDEHRAPIVESPKSPAERFEPEPEPTRQPESPSEPAAASRTEPHREPSPTVEFEPEPRAPTPPPRESPPSPVVVVTGAVPTTVLDYEGTREAGEAEGAATVVRVAEPARGDAVTFEGAAGEPVDVSPPMTADGREGALRDMAEQLAEWDKAQPPEDVHIEHREPVAESALVDEHFEAVIVVTEPEEPDQEPAEGRRSPPAVVIADEADSGGGGGTAATKQQHSLEGSEQSADTVIYRKDEQQEQEPSAGDEGTRTPPPSPQKEAAAPAPTPAVAVPDTSVATSQQRESVEEGYIDEQGNVVVSKKVTRVVTTTKTTYEEVGGEPTVETVQTVESTGAGDEAKDKDAAARSSKPPKKQKKRRT